MTSMCSAFIAITRANIRNLVGGPLSRNSTTRTRRPSTRSLRSTPSLSSLKPQLRPSRT